MEVLKIIPSIIKDEDFKLTNAENWATPLDCRQGTAFRLFPKHDIHKHLFEVFFDNYFTNIDTDFILDVASSCVIQFDVDSLVPTVEDLYELYIKANHAVGWEIVKIAQAKGIKADLLPKNAPIEKQRDALNKTIEKMLTE
jgi:hypothetical protein